MLIAAGTTNPGKLRAMKLGLQQGWPDDDIEIKSRKTASGVRPMPLSVEETIAGATNRAVAALTEVPGANLGVGPEGGVYTSRYGMLLFGCVVVVGQDGRRGIGTSGSVLLPPVIQRRIEAGEELGPIMDELLSAKENEIRSTIGANGVLTGGLYSRVEEFVHATLCALAPWRCDLYER